MPSRSFSPRRRNVGVYLGYKLSSKPGLVLNGVAVVTVGALFVLFLTTYPGD
jgi:chromate transport protein ChrA